MTRPDARLSSLRLAFARIGLPAWFVVIDLLWIVRPITFAIDARHYQRAASVWLAGGDPWSVYESNVGYASGPHTLLLYAPTSLLPLVISVAIWMLIGTGVAFWILRRLGLPVWWFAFPPLFHAVWNGNPQTLMLALRLLATPLAAATASAVKLYALVPLLFRPRHLVVACLFLAVTMLILPWRLYLDAGGGVSGHLADAWNGSAWRLPFLVVPTAIALWVLRRDGADWWSIPAIWPATQFYYVSSALPAVVGRPFLAALIAVPAPLKTPIIVIALAIRIRIERHDPAAWDNLVSRLRASITRSDPRRGSP